MGFHPRARSKTILLTGADFCIAQRKDIPRGVAVGRLPAEKCPRGKYFEIVVQQIDARSFQSGLWVGVTSVDPVTLAARYTTDPFPDFAADVPQACVAGGEGVFWDGRGCEQVNWDTKELVEGDRIGVLVSTQWALQIYVNGVPVISAPHYDVGAENFHRPVYPLLQLHGATKSVRLLKGHEWSGPFGTSKHTPTAPSPSPEPLSPGTSPRSMMYGLASKVPESPPSPVLTPCDETATLRQFLGGGRTHRHTVASDRGSSKGGSQSRGTSASSFTDEERPARDWNVTKDPLLERMAWPKPASRKPSHSPPRSFDPWRSSSPGDRKPPRSSEPWRSSSPGDRKTRSGSQDPPPKSHARSRSGSREEMRRGRQGSSDPSMAKKSPLPVVPKTVEWGSPEAELKAKKLHGAVLEYQARVEAQQTTISLLEAKTMSVEDAKNKAQRKAIKLRDSLVQERSKINAKKRNWELTNEALESALTAEVSSEKRKINLQSLEESLLSQLDKVRKARHSADNAGDREKATPSSSSTRRGRTASPTTGKPHSPSTNAASMSPPPRSERSRTGVVRSTLQPIASTPQLPKRSPQKLRKKTLEEQQLALEALEARNMIKKQEVAALAARLKESSRMLWKELSVPEPLQENELQTEMVTRSSSKSSSVAVAQTMHLDTITARSSVAVPSRSPTSPVITALPPEIGPQLVSEERNSFEEAEHATGEPAPEEDVQRQLSSDVHRMSWAQDVQRQLSSGGLSEPAPEASCTGSESDRTLPNGDSGSQWRFCELSSRTLPNSDIGMQSESRQASSVPEVVDLSNQPVAAGKGRLWRKNKTVQPTKQPANSQADRRQTMQPASQSKASSSSPRTGVGNQQPKRPATSPRLGKKSLRQTDDTAQPVSKGVTSTPAMQNIAIESSLGLSVGNEADASSKSKLQRRSTVAVTSAAPGAPKAAAPKSLPGLKFKWSSPRASIIVQPPHDINLS